MEDKNIKTVEPFMDSELIDPNTCGRSVARLNIEKSLRAQAIDAVCCNEGLGDELFAREVLGEAKMAYNLHEMSRTEFYEFHDLLVCLFYKDKYGQKVSCREQIVEMGW